VNGVIAEITARQLLSGRRAILVAVLPALLLGVAIVVRTTVGVDRTVAAEVLDGFALGVVVPLLGLVAGIGAIGGEIDDGSLVYLVTKPVSRYSIATTKALVATAVAVVAAAGATWLAALVLGLDQQVAGAFGLAAALAAVGYVAVIVALAVVTRAAVPIGLLYVLVWEGVVGGFVPGARALSIRQWASGVAEGALGDRAFEASLDAAVGPWTGGILLAATVVAATWYAGRRLGRVRVTGDA
jgi:ABC-2 type transport system permease protein